METLQDGRLSAQIPTENVWLSIFGMFALRLGSLNAVEQELRRPKLWESLVGDKKPSADTIGYALKRFSLDSLRQLLLSVNRQAWRMKSIQPRPGEKFRVIGLDGHELFSSQARCCSDCLVREVEISGKKETSYYHRVVVAQWVGVTPPAILDWELLRPGEGEVVAARRLLERLLEGYARLFDVVTADALYLEGPFIRQVLDAGKHVVVVMKQEARDLYKDADSLREKTTPAITQEGGRLSKIWDIPDLGSFSTVGRPMRVVWCHEQETKTAWIGGKKQEVREEKTWIWVTDLPVHEATPHRIQRWGHDRWDLENRGFNELDKLWGMDHCFIHQSTAILTLLLTLAVAFLTTYLFYERNLKEPVRKQLTRLALAGRLKEELCRLGGGSVWTLLEFSG